MQFGKLATDLGHVALVFGGCGAGGGRRRAILAFGARGATAPAAHHRLEKHLLLALQREGPALASRVADAALTPRETEVLSWLAKGKTNRDIGEIGGSSPATVKKHLERVYVKLGVETRTAAGGVAMQRIRALQAR